MKRYLPHSIISRFRFHILNQIFIVITVLHVAGQSVWADSCSEAFGRFDYAAAYGLCLQSAGEGDSNGQANLGWMYERGKGVTQDYSEAVKWYGKAAAQGNAAAQNNLGVMCVLGQGTSVDYAEAFKWYRKSAEQGNATAQNNLGGMYENGNGVPQDFTEALKWYRKSAGQDFTEAKFHIGFMYHYGQGVQQDFPEAVKWYRMAAEQGYPDAQHNLGCMYDSGQGVPQDYAEAVKWFRKAADQGILESISGLGEMYEYGKGVGPDYAEALKWYGKAAEQGHGESIRALKRLSQSAWGTPHLQKLLAGQGFDPGSIDGVLGNKTLQAARQYHDQNKLDCYEYYVSAIHNDLWDKALTRAPSGSTPPAASPVVRDITYGSYHALVIGIENYQHLTPLKTAIDDAQAVAGLLKEKYGFQVKILIDATRSDIFSAVGQYRKTLRPEDNLLIYYAGHGEMDKSTDRGYWLPKDAEEDNRSNWIPNEDITNDLKAMKARHVLVVCDSCYAGTLTRGSGASSIKDGGDTEWVKRMADKTSRTALTSGGIETVLDAGGGNHSVFADSFIRTLSENDHVIDMDSLFDTIKRRVILNARQTPKYEDIRYCGHDDGDFVWNPR